MGANLFWFNDEQWAKIVPHLPFNQPGPKRKDDRRILSGIMHVLKIGCRWQDCPKNMVRTRRSTTAFPVGVRKAFGKRYLHASRVPAIRPNKLRWTAAMSKSTAAPTAEKGA